jgi:hypothetical protein
MSEHSKKTYLSELRERAAKHLEYIRRNRRFSSGEKSELEDIHQLIREEKRGAPFADEEGEDGVVR